MVLEYISLNRRERCGKEVVRRLRGNKSGPLHLCFSLSRLLVNYFLLIQAPAQVSKE